MLQLSWHHASHQGAINAVKRKYVMKVQQISLPCVRRNHFYQKFDRQELRLAFSTTEEWPFLILPSRKKQNNFIGRNKTRRRNAKNIILDLFYFLCSKGFYRKIILMKPSNKYFKQWYRISKQGFVFSQRPGFSFNCYTEMLCISG